ncbi:MAG: flagellar basal body-associated FliL family protein [Acidobacteria bacterium]|nr:MAG: flagellar basal body-associated FliL family protein [Acidobacteriota bacterium]
MQGMRKRLRIAAAPVAFSVMLLTGCGMLHGGGKKVKAAAATLPLRVITLPTSVYNLDDPTPAYLRLGVSLGLNTPTAKDDVAVQTVARDTLVNLVTAQTSAVLLTPAGKENLKKAVLAEMQKRLPDAGVREVYFDQFLIQR